MYRSIEFFACCITTLLVAASQPVHAGIYSEAAGDPTNLHDAPIPGYIGPDGAGVVSENNAVNPAFVGWATGHRGYAPAPGVDSQWQMPAKALGPATGDNFDIASLGDLDQQQIDAGIAPGRITLTFDQPITDGPGADLAVFENALGSAASVNAELAYVEVSSNGTDFARFPSVSQTADAVPNYGFLDPTNIYNLAGKHLNAYGQSWGTPFDLGDLSGHALVLDGTVDMSRIMAVRIIDIPGSGDFADASGNPIYDQWETFGSGGFDLEALGVLNAVPEPTSALLLAGAGGLLLGRGRGRS